MRCESDSKNLSTIGLNFADRVSALKRKKRSGEKPKLVLIEPKPPGEHIYSKLKLPRLGAVLLGVIAREHGWDVKIYVENIAPIDFAEALTADLVGLSTITSTAERAYSIADELREFGVPVVFGGPHVTFLADEALDHADFVVRGEGEEALPMLLDALEGAKEFSEVPNLSYHGDGGEALHNAQTSSIENLDDLPFPDFDLIVGWKTTKSFHTYPIIPIQATRGCPFGCRFCSVIGMFGRKLRSRSVDSVLQELERYRDEGVHVFFYDDNFTANGQWTRELLARVESGKPYWKSWSAQVRTNTAKDEELLSMMRRTNCTNVYIGFESVNPRALKEMHKGQSVEDMHRAIAAFKRHKLDVHGMFVFGFDTDDKETLAETTRFAIDSGILSAQFLILTPLPGTPLYRDLETADRLKGKTWSHYDGHHVMHEPKHLSVLELQKAQVRAHVRFYSRARMFKQLVRGHLPGGFIYMYARRLIRTWKRDNRFYLKALKLAESARGISARYNFEIDLSDIRDRVTEAARELFPTDALPPSMLKHG